MKTTLTPAQINAHADALIAAGSPFVFSEAGKAVCEVAYYDGLAVAAEVARRERVAAIEAFETTAAIKKYMLDNAAARGAQKPEKRDCRYFAKAAQRTTSQFGTKREAYKPVGNCGLRMQLEQAVSFSHTQESYSDDSVTLIPVTGDVAKADMKACHANVGAFFRYADSHTGMAGSGCNYSASLHTNELGAFIAVHCRASIAD